MTWLSGILLLLLILTANSAPPDGQQWKTTLSCPTPDTSIYITEPATSSATLSFDSVPITGALPAADRETQSFRSTTQQSICRLPGAMGEKVPDYYDDEIYEATFEVDGSRAALVRAHVPESAAEYEAPAYYDGEIHDVVVGGARPHPASDNAPVVEGASSPGRRGRGDDASRGKDTAPSSSTATKSRREESGAVAAPEPTNWTSWLPAWCRRWLLYHPLGVPRGMILQTFSDTLAEYATGIGSYWVQTEESADTDELPRTAEPQPELVSMAMQQIWMLQGFNNWIYQQSNTKEINCDSNTVSPYHVLDVLERQVALVNSVYNWLCSMCLICNALDAGTLRNFFWVIDRQSVLVQILHRTADNQYSLTAGPGRHPHWWQPFKFEVDTSPFNESHFSTRNLTEGDNALGAKAVRHRVCTIEDIRGERELKASNINFEVISWEATSHRNSCCFRRYETRKLNDKEGKVITCGQQNISIREPETGQLIVVENKPIGGPEDVTPDEGFYEEDAQHVPQPGQWLRMNVVEGDEEEVQCSRQQMGRDGRTFGICSETPVFRGLGSNFQPRFLRYVTCNVRDEVCDPQESCQPVHSVVTLEAVHRAVLPEFPHYVLAARRLPNGNNSLTLLVATSCSCALPFDEDELD